MCKRSLVYKYYKHKQTIKPLRPSDTFHLTAHALVNIQLLRKRESLQKPYITSNNVKLVANPVILTFVLINTTKYNFESELKCLSLKFVLKCSISSFNKPLRERLRWNFVLLELVEVRLTYHSRRACRSVSRFFVSLWIQLVSFFSVIRRKVSFVTKLLSARNAWTKSKRLFTQRRFQNLHLVVVLVRFSPTRLNLT